MKTGELIQKDLLQVGALAVAIIGLLQKHGVAVEKTSVWFALISDPQFVALLTTASALLLVVWRRSRLAKVGSLAADTLEAIIEARLAAALARAKSADRAGEPAGTTNQE